MNKEDIKNAINTIKTYLGMDVKLAQMKLADGVTILEFDSLEVGKEVFIVSENGNVPLPMGEYELEDGNILEVYEDGIIGEVKSKEEEQPPLEEEEPAMPVEASVEPQQSVKKVIKSTIEEQHFAEIEKLKAEIVELKSMIEQKEEVKEEVIELAQEEEVKPISFNPENVNEIKAVKLNSNKSMSMRDRILQTVYNK
ncbi:hypothetical protein UFOVP627_31 [uncultured Caudovirales phage]|uniref:Uncharacterized protein n=1 Tax=uncultured Caudovirales phage TaxID=2100421 RepID=A0A6J5N947_9CAUD|nr:hypothetical protein UFOVP627_31 [uncultured Caudovirales phage]